MPSDLLTIIEGNALERMAELPDRSVHVIVTSPPYWGLRDYKIPASIWGGDAKCKHRWGASLRTVWANRVPGPNGARLNGKHSQQRPKTTGPFCSKCGAWRGVFGLEPSSQLYVEHAVLLFREAYRILRNDGTLWLNLGDSFAPTGGDRRDHVCNWGVRQKSDASSPRMGRIEQSRHLKASGLKGGDLVGIPWRVALALQGDGWYLRRDNIWFKPNPMPESVRGWSWERHVIKVKAGWTKENHPSALGGSDKSRSGCFGSHNGTKASDNAAEFVDCPGCDKCRDSGGLILRKGNWRCTTSHEYVFQFSKTPSYFCDAEAARERTTGNAHDRGRGVNPKAKRAGRNSRMAVDRDPAHSSASAIQHKQNVSFSAAVRGITGDRNMRSVWRVPTFSYRGAHFATFPAKLIRPIIQASTSARCCPSCLAPFAPVVLKGERRAAQQRACGSDANGVYAGQATKEFELHGAQNASAVKARILAGMVERKVVDYKATCQCGVEGWVPAVVLDMFGGSGTVGEVSLELGRRAILIEIASQYIPLIKRRCEVVLPLGL